MNPAHGWSEADIRSLSQKPSPLPSPSEGVGVNGIGSRKRGIRVTRYFDFGVALGSPKCMRRAEKAPATSISTRVTGSGTHRTSDW